MRAPLDWAQLDQQEPPPREWIIPLWLPAGHVTLVVGKAGVGKTLLTQCIGTAVSQGHDYLECIRPRRVLFWAGEDDEAKLWRRQVAICGAFDPIAVDRPLASLAGRLFAYSYAGADITLATPVQGVLRPTPMLETLRGHVRDHGAELVILDNVARLFGGNENDRHQVTVFISLVQAACAPAAVLLIGHPSKIAGSEYSGSTAWEGAVRTRLYFGDRPPDVADTEDAAGDNVRYLARRKSNYSALDLRRFTLVGGALLPDAVEPATAVTDVVARDLVLRAVGQLAAAGQHMSASVASPGYLPKLARQYQLLGSLGERAFASTMRKMLLDGSLVTREVGKYANRAPRMGVALP